MTANFFHDLIFTVLAWKNRLAAEVSVNRMNPFKIPFLERKESEIDRYEDERRKNEEREIERNSGSNSQRGIEREKVSSTIIGFSSQSEKLTKSTNLLPIAKINLQNELNNYKTKRNQLQEKSKHEKHIIASLVTLRARKKGMRENLEKCLKYCEKVPSSSSHKNGFKSLSELVLACLESVEDNISKKFVDYNNSSYNNNNINNNHIDDNNDNNNNNNNNNNRENLEVDDKVKNNYYDDISDQRLIEETNQRAWLGSLLISHPETFLAILDILGKFLLPAYFFFIFISLYIKFQSLLKQFNY